MVKLKDLVEDLELGKVYTDKDRPPFQVKEGQKRQSREITAKFDKAYLNFAKEVRDVIKMIDRYQGDKTDGKIIDKVYSKGLVPLDKLMKSWNSGQQKNPHIDEQTINEAPDNELFKRLSKLQAEIFKLLNNYKSKANVPAIARSFMIGLKNQLKKDKMVESKTSDMMKAIRKGPKAGPWILIVSKNNKVVSQVSVKNLKEIPAYLAALRPRYPNHRIGIEAKDGKIVYREQDND